MTQEDKNSHRQIYFGLGANLGDPIQQMLDAKSMLVRDAKAWDVRSSQFYVSSPVGYADQPTFVNSVVSMTSHLSCEQVLEMLQSIEKSFGRERDAENQNAPRVIDIDILFYGDSKIVEHNLSVPHPRMLDRRFVLEPLLEILPDSHYQYSACNQAKHQLAKQSDQYVAPLVC